MRDTVSRYELGYSSVKLTGVTLDLSHVSNHTWDIR